MQTPLEQALSIAYDALTAIYNLPERAQAIAELALAEMDAADDRVARPENHHCHRALIDD